MRAGWPEADAVAALFVSVLVILAAVRLGRRNVDVLMDRAPADDVAAARTAIAWARPARSSFAGCACAVRRAVRLRTS